MTIQAQIGLVRSFCLLWPGGLLFLLVWWRRPQPRPAGAALVATLWNVFALLLLQLFADRLDWWTFHAQQGMLLGIPGELLLGWSLLWGAVPLLTFPSASLWKPVSCAVALDLLVMPACVPVVQLGRHWLVGEAVAILLALLPGLLLGRMIQEKSYLKIRVSVLVIAYVGFVFFVIPSLILEQTGSSWRTALERPREITGLFFQIVFIFAVPGLSAVHAFCQQGQGTPLPFDPPRRLVTNGPYAYLANPMQTSTLLVFLLLGWWTSSLWVAGGALFAFLTGAGIAGWQEHTHLKKRFGIAWSSYRNDTRNWVPRWRPRIFSPCTLYLAETCGPCSQIARWFQARNPTGLIIVPAETHPSRNLRRMTYEAPGLSESGIQALARALEHINLGWAWVGWILRLPILCRLIQGLTDLSGGGERTVQRR